MNIDYAVIQGTLARVPLPPVRPDIFDSEPNVKLTTLHRPETVEIPILQERRAPRSARQPVRAIWLTVGNGF